MKGMKEIPHLVDGFLAHPNPPVFALGLNGAGLISF